MKAFFIIVFSFSMLLLFRSQSHAQDLGSSSKERASANEAARRSISELLKILGGLSEESFSQEGIGQPLWLSKIEIPIGTPRINALRQQVQFLIAQIDLAQDYPETDYKGQFTVEEFLQNNDYFGVAAAHDFQGFEKKQALIEKLFDDRELDLGNRFFGLMQTGVESREEAFAKWVKHIEKMSGPYYLGTTFERQPTTLIRSLVGLTLLRGVIHSSQFQEVLNTRGGLKTDYEVALTKLKKSAIHFARERFQKGGMLRDWCLPVASAISRIYPDQSRETIGVTSLAEFKETSLTHARSITELVSRIDDSTVSAAEANRALQSVKFYRSQSYYIGSLEIRENGTLKVPVDQEVETLIQNALFFGPDGHVNTKTYQKRTEHLDKLFLGSDGEVNLALLVDLKSNEQWIDFFDRELFGGKKQDGSAVFPHLNQKHSLTMDHLKVLFLARAVLPSEPFLTRFQGKEELKAAYNDLMIRFGHQVRATSSLQFRNFPKEWANMQNGFLEIAKGFPEYNFERLNVTTSTDLQMVRKGFEDGLYGNESVAEDLVSLFLPDSPALIPSIDHMTSERLSRRTGKFDKRLSPEFVNRVNGKLDDILEYRNYGLAAIDTLERPDLQAGRIMTHFGVSDFRLPGDKKTNTVMHDFVCGPNGGFGGLGMIFKPDPKGYREIESVLDALATSEQLNLGETLFLLATEVNRENLVTDKDRANAAKRWITYFRKSQANAQFHTVPEVINEAIRGTFLSRLVFESDSFQQALESSREAAVGSELDISEDFEAAVSAQIRKMQAMLSQIDPATASNRNLEETAAKWQSLKVWYLESTKWMESVIDDPLLVSEVARVRKLKRKSADYQELCPEVLVFKKSLEHSDSEVNEDQVPITISLARFAMEKVTELEPDLNLPLPEAEGSVEDEEKHKQQEYGKAISSQFLNDIREIVRKAGFEKLANVNDPSQIGAAVEELLAKENSSPGNSEADLEIEADAMKEAFQTAAAKAISRVEAEQPSDFRTLAEQSVRASKVDQILTSQELEQYRIYLRPSLVLRDWVDRNRVEVMTDYRTMEIAAEARHMTNLAKEERRSLKKVQNELEAIKAESIQKKDILQRWIDQSQGGTNVEVMTDEVIAMRKEMSSLKKEVSELKDSEAVMRSRAAEYAQLVFQYKRGGAQSIENRERSLIAEANREAAKEEGEPGSGAIVAATSSNDGASGNRNSTSKKKPTYSATRSSSSNSSTGFFQRLFGRRR